MTIEATIIECSKVEQVEAPIKSTKSRIVFFTGQQPMAINLNHVSVMRLEGKTLYFEFHTKTLPVDLTVIDEEAANSVFQALINLWSNDV